jgi:hypothetical protein
MGISLKTHKMLWGNSANRCSLPSCRRVLAENETETDDASIVGDEAHIISREESGPRGKSDLTPEQRDMYDNLILMCKIHHKLVDDQEKTYTVEILHQMKNDHIEWVNRNLSPDVDKQSDDLVYATYIEKWIEFAQIEDWKNWTTSVLSNGQPSISIENFKKLQELNEYIFSRVWPKRYEKIEFAFMNFRAVLNDFINVFSKYIEVIGSKDNQYYLTEKFYKRSQDWDYEKYSELLKKFDYHVDLVEDLMLELTRWANYICDMIRNYFMRSFRIKEGALLISTGPNIYLKWKTLRIEFDSQNEIEIVYKGLRNFMSQREKYDFHFGSGESEDYFPLKIEY